MKEFPQPTEPGYYWARFKDAQDTSKFSIYYVFRDRANDCLYVHSILDHGIFIRDVVDSYTWLSEKIIPPKGAL